MNETPSPENTTTPPLPAEHASTDLPEARLEDLSLPETAADARGPVDSTREPLMSLESGASPFGVVEAVVIESTELPSEVVSDQAELPLHAPQQNVALTIQLENSGPEVSFSQLPDAPFQSSLALSLGCTRENAQIRYALGASDVGEDGLIFDPKDTILLTQSTLVAARAFENGERGPLLVGKFEINKPLWQEIEPTDQSDATPHKLGDSGQCEDGWKVSAGSVRGKLHAHRGMWREDSFGFSSAKNGAALWQIVAVSDGAGSAPLSRVGSRLACDASIRALQTSLAALPEFSPDQEQLASRDLPLLLDTLVHAARAALEAIQQEAQQRGEPLAAFAATLLVLVRREWNGKQLCANVQVGDGVVALWGESGLTLLGVADHGQQSGETRFLTTRGIETELASRVKFSIKDDLLAFAVLSDGVSDDYFPEDKRLGEVFEAVLPLLQSESNGSDALISWLGYEKKGSSDDRTLVVSWKNDSPMAGLDSETATPALLEMAKTEAPDVDSDRDAG